MKRDKKMIVILEASLITCSGTGNYMEGPIARPDRRDYKDD